MPLLLGIALLLWNRLLLRLGLRRRVNGWRRGAALVLRGDAAKFVLSAFNLDIFSDDRQSTESAEDHIAQRLAKILQAAQSFHFVVRHEAEQDRVVAHDGASYSLTFEPWRDGPTRFIRPDAWKGTDASPLPADSAPLFEFVGRVSNDRLSDLWVRIHHVAIDGVEAQELMTQVEQAWGMGNSVSFPTTDEFAPLTAPRSSPDSICSRAGTAEVQTFLDFSPLLAWRKRVNQTLDQPMTFSAALMWWMGKHEHFAPLFIGTTVGLPAMDDVGTGVAIVVVRASDYFDRSDGLQRYVREFNHQLELTRQRESAGCKILDAAAFLPAKIEETLLRRAVDEGGRAFGSVGLTILKDAKVFGAPLGDTGHVNGFIAIGSTALEASDGSRVGCVCVKGPRERIANYARILREVIERVSD